MLQTKQVRACNGVAGSGGGAAAATGEQCYNNSREEWAEQGGHQKMSQGAAWTVLIEVLERRAGGSRARPASARGPPMAGRVLHGLHIFPIFLYPRHACRKAFISCSSSWQASWPGQGGREGGSVRRAALRGCEARSSTRAASDCSSCRRASWPGQGGRRRQRTPSQGAEEGRRVQAPGAVHADDAGARGRKCAAAARRPARPPSHVPSPRSPLAPRTHERIGFKLDRRAGCVQLLITAGTEEGGAGGAYKCKLSLPIDGK